MDEKTREKIANLKRELSKLHGTIKFQKKVINLQNKEITELKGQNKRLTKALADATDHIVGK